MVTFYTCTCTTLQVITVLYGNLLYMYIHVHVHVYVQQYLLHFMITCKKMYIIIYNIFSWSQLMVF